MGLNDFIFEEFDLYYSNGHAFEGFNLCDLFPGNDIISIAWILMDSNHSIYVIHFIAII